MSRVSQAISWASLLTLAFLAVSTRASASSKCSLFKLQELTLDADSSTLGELSIHPGQSGEIELEQVADDQFQLCLAGDEWSACGNKTVSSKELGWDQ